ncbi:hypothetical protein ZIOFF_008166 [Zingiber officinale]|uniref:Uncharacterized protein n=1 Tax=Zingiber officinale TaxID=94328 RepID=A0A8J5LQL9_ZINOF|nr:hypothetical protein ZIOFF_008166 [Zingiber officinale]
MSDTARSRPRLEAETLAATRDVALLRGRDDRGQCHGRAMRPCRPAGMAAGNAMAARRGPAALQGWPWLILCRPVLLSHLPFCQRTDSDRSREEALRFDLAWRKFPTSTPLLLISLPLGNNLRRSCLTSLRMCIPFSNCTNSQLLLFFNPCVLKFRTRFSQIRGNKCLVIDPKLSGSLSLLIQTSLLKENGVELRHLSSEPVQTECSKILYLVRSHTNLMKLISSNIHNDLSKGVQREYFLYFVPRRTIVCEKIFEDEKIHHLLTIGEYPLYMLPLDEDVISFELDLSYKECCVDGDTSSLWHIAKAIHKLEFSFGFIPNVRAKGKASTKVAEILNSLQVEEPVSSTDLGIPEINTLILLDREVDLVTPMCFQLTYEGLLDEILQINNGSVEVDTTVMGSQQDGKKVKVPLNSSDKLFKEIRDMNFEVVVQVLRQKATSIQQDYAEVKSQSQSVSELKDFVKKLNSLPEIARHVNLAQHLQSFTSKPSFHARLDIEQTLLELQNYDICFEYIEEMIHKQESLVNVLRLLVLFSITNSGLPKKNFDYLR